MKNSDAVATVMVTLFVAVCIFLMSSCGSCKRFIKEQASDFSAGIERTVTLYDYNGKVIKKWEGKIDMSNSRVESYFLIGEKRVIIHGGIVVVEEK